MTSDTPNETPKEILDLADIVWEFNAKYINWSKKSGYGVNFEFRYGKDGTKHMSILDFSPLPAPPSKKSVASANEILQEALSKIPE